MVKEKKKFVVVGAWPRVDWRQRTGSDDPHLCLITTSLLIVLCQVGRLPQRSLSHPSWVSSPLKEASWYACLRRKTWEQDQFQQCTRLTFICPKVMQPKRGHHQVVTFTPFKVMVQHDTLCAWVSVCGTCHRFFPRNRLCFLRSAPYYHLLTLVPSTHCDPMHAPVPSTHLHSVCVNHSPQRLRTPN